MIHESPLPSWHQPAFWVKCTEHLAGTEEYICRMHYCFHVWNWIHGLGLHLGCNNLLILKRKAFFTCSKHDPCISHSSLASCSCSFIYLYLICYGLWLIKHLCFYFFVLEISCSYIVSWAVLHWQYNFHFYTCLIPIFLWNLKLGWFIMFRRLLLWCTHCHLKIWVIVLIFLDEMDLGPIVASSSELLWYGGLCLGGANVRSCLI